MAPEDLAGVLLEIVPKIQNPDHFQFDSFLSHTAQWGAVPGSPNYSTHDSDKVLFAVAEAFSWLIAQGIVMRDPRHANDWYLLTRRGREIASRKQLKHFKQASTLPRLLLQPILDADVYSLFAQGKYDLAVAAAFRRVELAVRERSGLPGEFFGAKLMARAFDPTRGILRNSHLPRAEREAERQLFVSATGHARNPPLHRNVDHSRESAARLIVFASHLLDLVESRPTPA